MKLGFFISSMDGGGAERVMAILVNNFVEKGHEVHLFVYSENNSFYQLDPRIMIHRLGHRRNYLGKPGLFAGHLLSAIRAIQLIRKYRLDGIVGFITFINCMAILIGKFAKVPVMISERNDPLQYKVRAAAAFMRKRLYKRANSIVLQTGRSIHSFENLQVELPRSKKVILNPIDPSFVDNKLEREKVILSVGRLSFEKGHDLLLKAFANIRSKEWKLHIVGDGPEKENLSSLAINLKIDRSVVWHGKKNNVGEFLNRCAIYVLPSRTEGFPNALCEAMACGCAVISFDCPNGPSEIITNGQNGLLVSPEDVDALTNALDKLIADEKLREKFRTEAATIKDRLDQSLIISDWEAHMVDVFAKVKTRKI